MGFVEFFTKVFGQAFFQTMYMTIVPTIIATILGFVIAIILVVTAPEGLSPNKTLNATLGFIVNVFRSFPFIILIIALIPFTRIIAGTSIGETA
ncbi:MAG: methionine ABC transporter permease, partial [Clostridioides sp.]|nr:methionine ABC transporter permease [Clostridioides sp.]